MKIIALYLPQYHEIKENNKWWGKGYTEWDAVKNAKPLFRGHYQPKVPLDQNYYDLSDKSGKVWSWQADLAKKHDVYGFCIYNYWFEGKQLLEGPIEVLLKHPEIDIHYCICWANETWTKTWYGLETEILMKQTYGDKQAWITHFNYLLRFFKDKRYIKIDNKPLINIYRTSDIEDLEQMRMTWNDLALKNGFNGIYIVAGNNNGMLEKRDVLVDAYYNFEPSYTLKHKMNFLEKIVYGIPIWIKQRINKIFKTEILERKVNTNKINRIMKRKIEKTNKTIYQGAFPMWDNTPRRSYKGMVYTQSSPSVFSNRLNQIEKEQENEDEFVYINAWNEWGEGCYLEPDEENGFEYLKAIKDVASLKDS